MAYNTPYTPYEGYQEVNQCLCESGLDILVQIREFERKLVYALYLDGVLLGRSTNLNELLHNIYSELGAMFMRKYFLKSKLEKHGIDNL